MIPRLPPGDFVALLGTKGGPAIRPGSSMPTSSLVVLGGTAVVVDCGLGVTSGLVRLGFPLKALGHIVITHLHSDHILEFGPLLHTAWTAGLSTPVEVTGPAGLSRYWAGFVASMADDIDLRIADEGRPDLRALVQLRPLVDGAEATCGALTVEAVAAIHPPLDDCHAIALAGNGRRVVFSGDTAPLPELDTFARGADLLVHEAMLAAALPALMARIGNADDRLMRHWLRSHTLAQDAARTAARAGVKALALHHLIPADDPAYGEADWHAAAAPHWSGPLHLGRDGLVIPL